MEQRLNKSGVRANTPRERMFVQLVGVPVSDNTLKAKFAKLPNGDEPIYPDKEEDAKCE